MGVAVPCLLPKRLHLCGERGFVALRAKAALGVDDGDVAHSQPICTTMSRTCWETSFGERPWLRHLARAEPSSFSRADHCGPNSSARCSRTRRDRPGTWPPVEAVSSNSPRRTMAGTWKSQRAG